MKNFGVNKLPVTGSPRLSPEDRLDIYANMYFYRIRDSLKEDFPALFQLMGENHWHNLITLYLAKYPPTHFSLRYAGNKLAPFIKKTPFFKKWPYVSDLAALEWDLLNVFDAIEEVPITRVDLQSVPAESWPALRFKLIQACQIKTFKWPVGIIWKDVIKGKKSIKYKKTKTDLLIWRQNYQSYYRPIDSLEKKLLAGIKKNDSFETLCSKAKEASTMAGYLMTWVNEGLIAQVNNESA